MPTPPEFAYLVHGEDASRRALAQRICKQNGRCVVVPRLGETVRLDS